VADRLWEVPEQLATIRVYFLGQQTKIIGEVPIGEERVVGDGGAGHKGSWVRTGVLVSSRPRLS
jgi:hypothetical protein